MNEILTSASTLTAAATSEAPFEEVAVEGDESVAHEERMTDAELKPELLRGIQLRVRVELGRRSVTLKDALRLDTGSVIDLEKSGDDPVDLYVNDQLLARGIVMVVDDRFCIRVTEVLPRE